MRIFLAAAVCALVLFAPISGRADAPVFARNGGLKNLAALKSAIVAYYTSGRYAADATAVDERLQSDVDSRLKAGVKKPAVVFDIDDTMLSSFGYERSHDFGYDPQSWSQWERTDRFPPIAPTLRLARHLAAEHVAIFFITGRRQPDLAVTRREVALAGYPAPAGLYLRPVSDRAKSVIPFKSRMRAAIAARGYDILASVGDQWSDLRGGHADRLYKLPNPMYFLP